MPWTCLECGDQHETPPLCFAAVEPWRLFVPDDEVEQRVHASDDQCSIDGKVFLLRGHIEIPIHDYPEPLAYSVWVSLSPESARHVARRWNEPDRADDPPYFGWLCTALPEYPDTVQLKTSVQSRPPGEVPHVLLEPTDHPLAREQHEGISIHRWHQLAHRLLGHRNAQQSEQA